MEKSRCRGIPSLNLRPQAEVSTNLQKIVQITPLKELHVALGKEAQLHVVGGTIRDIAEGKDPHDFDLASIFPPERSSKILSERGFRIIETGLRHGTITILVDQHSIELTTFRKQNASSPTDYGDSMEVDLGARDFTLNALAFSCDSQQLLDPYAGLKDISDNLLKAVGNAHDRFKEDPLRILRMIRFGAAVGRVVDEATFEAAKSQIQSVMGVSVERILSELRKIITSTYPRGALEQMQTLGLLTLIFPEVIPSIGFEQNEFHTEDVFQHTLSVVAACPPDELLRWTGFFHDLGKPHTISTDENGRRHFYLHEIESCKLAEGAMQRLRFSNEMQTSISTLVRHHMRPLECGPPGVRRLMRDLGTLFPTWRQFKVADSPPTMAKADFEARLDQFDAMVVEENERLQAQAFKLAVDGYDLMNMGYTPGVQLGQTLKALEELVMDDPNLNSKEVLLQKAKELHCLCEE